MMKRFLMILLFALGTPVFGAYHLELEAHPAAVFPYFAKFGTITIHVYEGGLRGDTMWLDAFSRNGSPDITILNPLARLYIEVPVTDISATINKLGQVGDVERDAVATLGPSIIGKVRGIKATRHRLVYGPAAYIDVWTTDVIPENPQLRRVIDELVSSISPGTHAVSKKIRGTPIYVELNFQRYQKLVLVRMKNLTKTADDEKEALRVGRYYLKAPFADAIFK